jgi:hypothetical protein
MGGDVYHKRGKVLNSENVTDEDRLHYLDGNGDGCPSCGSAAKGCSNHMRREHGITKAQLFARLGQRECQVECEYHEEPKKCSKNNISRCLTEAMRCYVKRLKDYG